MRFRVIGSFGGDAPGLRMTSFLVDGALAVDAGALTRVLTIEEQTGVRHILLSHSHMDHTASLPFLIENSFSNGERSINIYCTAKVLANVRRHLFNNDTWPDFSRIPDRLYPSIRFVEVEPGRPFVIDDLPGDPVEVTAVPVNHIVPTVGFLLRQGGRSILFTSDTGPTDEVWRVANAQEDIAAVITECSFPSSLQRIADVSLHLTPTTLATELEKLDASIPVLLYHFKPPYVADLRAELATISFRQDVRELEQDRVYEF